MVYGPQMPYRGSLPHPPQFRSPMHGPPAQYSPFGPMGSPRPQMMPGPRGGPRQAQGPMRQRQGGGLRQAQGPMRQRQGGGLLSRLLGGGARNTNGMRGPASAGFPLGGAANPSQAGGGLLRSLTNPQAISGFLTNTQKVLGTAQQIGPMIQQYGPIVKNIPAMWRIYKGLSSDTEETPAEESTEAKSESSVKKAPASKTKKKKVEIDPAVQESDEKEDRGTSMPKLYI